MSKKLAVLAGFVAGVVLAALAFAASAKTYQVTGPVLEINNDMIAVQKGKDRWEIARDGSTKMPAGVKVGDKVTIEYRMTATSVEVKSAPASKSTKKAA
ncbi:MAG TPA: hypothetical protein VEG84_00465 [Thermoanaerobaculia bacterium]|nr:hypothetical protein [Thermoanaerobaculia bacterium]